MIPRSPALAATPTHLRQRSWAARRQPTEKHSTISLPARAAQFGALLGISPPMRALFADLARITQTELCVLIEGETGTGKELVASSLHAESTRASGPFVVFDCGAVSPTLAESELFGHERGAFTGAVTTRLGVFEQARGGTIFLDEIGELSRALQPKLLRVLEKREVHRLGDTKAIALDVRVVAATNRNLRAEVKRGNFREDLYYRLAGALVNVPPLRDRLEDLELLSEALLAANQPPKSLADLPPATWQKLKAHDWPGNVRELKNALGRALISPERALETELRDGARDTETDELADGDEIDTLRVARRKAADEFEKAYVKRLLRMSGCNVSRAAIKADVSRQMIHRLMLKHGL